MTKLPCTRLFSRAPSLALILLVLCFAVTPAAAQTYGSPGGYATTDSNGSAGGSNEPQQPLLSPGQLSNLVAPVALYPDPLLSQILVVSTYPSELAAAGEWLQQTSNLTGPQLMDAARQQNWDPSIQALVAFPDVVRMLTSNLQWTTALGEAFLAQPADVMDAIQDLRTRARASGQLAPSAQYSIDTQYQDGQSAIEIVPANPQVIAVPAYDPFAVWGSPAEGAYPDLPYQGSDFGSVISSALDIAGMFVGFHGLLSPAGWGWALSWLAHTLLVNNSFLSDFGFSNSNGGYGGSSVWEHRGGYGAGGLLASNGAGWQGFGGSGGGAGRFGGALRAGTLAAKGGSGFNRGGWSGAGNWQQFAGGSRAAGFHSGANYNRPLWNSGRFAAAPGRFGDGGYPGGTPSRRNAFSGWRSSSPGFRTGGGGYPGSPRNSRNAFSGWRGSSPGFRGYSNSLNGASRSTFRAKQTAGRSWRHPFRSSQPRMNARPAFGGFSARRSPRPPKMPKAPRMPKAPHYSAPHFKSHGSPHVSHGHSRVHSHRR